LSCTSLKAARERNLRRPLRLSKYVLVCKGLVSLRRLAGKPTAGSLQARESASAFHQDVHLTASHGKASRSLQNWIWALPTAEHSCLDKQAHLQASACELLTAAD